MSHNSRSVKFLEPAAHVLLLGGAVALASIFWTSGNGFTGSPNHIVHIDSSKVLRSWEPTESRIFLFLSVSCPYCRRSMEFYARLGTIVDSLQQIGTPVRLAAVIDQADSAPAQRHLLQDSNVSVDTLLSLSSPSLTPVGIDGVPTVVLEKPDSGKPSVWVGLQDSTGEREILSAVRNLGMLR